MSKPPDETTELFGEVIYTYTRKQAIEDGEQVDVTEIAREAGLKFPVYLTRSVWASCVEVPPGVRCQDESGRLWDVVWMLRCFVSRGGDRIVYPVRVRQRGGMRVVRLIAKCGPKDIDDPQPAITIMLREDE